LLLRSDSALLLLLRLRFGLLLLCSDQDSAAAAAAAAVGFSGSVAAGSGMCVEELEGAERLDFGGVAELETTPADFEVSRVNSRISEAPCSFLLSFFLVFLMHSFVI
jgi:hypothetical protein